MKPRHKQLITTIAKWLTVYLAVAYLFMGLGPVDALLHFGSNFASMRGMLLQGLILMSFMVIQFGAMFWFLGRGTTYVLYPGEYDVGFDDVRGQWAAVDSTREVLHLFEGLRDFKERLGGEPPHGILMEGPPGTGKTMLAKAVAGETDVPFLFANGSGFTSMFMGIGNMKMRSLFKKARKFSAKYGGAVIFIDELDSIGGSRGAVSSQFSPATQEPIMMMGGAGGGGQGIINELLVQMDGLTTPKGLKRHVRRLLGLRRAEMPFYNLLIIGATNRASTLDPALLRAGRFDRKIHVGLPNAKGRADVAAYYLAKVRHEPIDVEKLARATMGYAPATIKNLVNEGLITALQEGRDAVTWNDLWRAKVAEEIGLVQAADYNARERSMIAAHEGAHAVAAHLLWKGERSVQIITIRKRENALGLVSHQENEETFTVDREQLRKGIMVSFAGMCAEEVLFGTVTSGPSSDLRHATHRAALMVGLYGMGKKYAQVSVKQDEDIIRAVMGSRGDEVEEIMQDAHEATIAFVNENQAAIEHVRDALVEHGEFIGDDAEALLVAATGQEA